MAAPADEQDFHSNASHGQRRTNKTSAHPKFPWIQRICRLLLFGYASQDSQRVYEHNHDWSKLHATLVRKVERIGIVAGLLLASNTTFMASGDFHSLTHASLSMSILASLLSILFTLLSLSVLGVQPTHLKKLVRHPTLFYYLCGTPSLFGGASALSFIFAVGSWTWLDEPAASRGWGPKVGALLLGATLVCNSGVCLFLGASPTIHKGLSDATPAGEYIHIPQTVQPPPP